MKRLLASLLITLLFGLTCAWTTRAQQPDAEKIHIKAVRAGTGENARVTVKLKNGTKIKGYIARAGDADFTVHDRQTDAPTTIAYADVAKLDTRRDKSALTSVVLGIAVGIGALFAVIGIVVAANN